MESWMRPQMRMGGLLLCGVVVAEHGVAELAGLGLVAPREGFAGIAEGPEGLLLGDLGGEVVPEDIEMVGEVPKRLRSKG